MFRSFGLSNPLFIIFILIYNLLSHDASSSIPTLNFCVHSKNLFLCQLTLRVHFFVYAKPVLTRYCTKRTKEKKCLAINQVMEIRCSVVFSFTLCQSHLTTFIDFGLRSPPLFLVYLLLYFLWHTLFLHLQKKKKKIFFCPCGFGQ